MVSWHFANSKQELEPQTYLCCECRSAGWRRQEKWGVTSQWVTVVSAATASTLRAVVTLVACITTESTSRNSKHALFAHAAFLLSSHPGYFGKKGQRHFHYQKNQYFKPTLNLDKLWTLVPEEARKASTAAKAVVIDVVKSVSALFNNNPPPAGLPQSPRTRRSPRDPMHCPRQGVLQNRREENQGRRWCLPTRLITRVPRRDHRPLRRLVFVS